MKIGVVGSMQHTDKMLALCDELRKLGHQPFITKFAPGMAGRNDQEIETMKLHSQPYSR